MSPFRRALPCFRLAETGERGTISARISLEISRVDVETRGGENSERKRESRGRQAGWLDLFFTTSSRGRQPGSLSIVRTPQRRPGIAAAVTSCRTPGVDGTFDYIAPASPGPLFIFNRRAGRERGRARAVLVINALQIRPIRRIARAHGVRLIETKSGLGQQCLIIRARAVTRYSLTLEN